MREDGGSSGVSANEYSCAHEAQIYFGDLTPYLTYGYEPWRLSSDFFAARVRLRACALALMAADISSCKYNSQSNELNRGPQLVQHFRL